MTKWASHYPSVPVLRAAADRPGPLRSWLIRPFETPSSTAALLTESWAAKRRRSSEVSLKQLRAQLTPLEERRSVLLTELGEQGVRKPG
jgi:hypothetical protein